MRKYLLAAVAAAAISSPALARDGSGYIGIEGGVLFGADTDIDGEVDFSDDFGDDGSVEYDDLFDIDYKMGWDGDLIAGYDFGMVRVEGELGYKSVKADDIEISSAFVGDFNDLIEEYNDGLGEDEEPLPLVTADDFNGDVNGRAKVLSGMVNVLFDLGADEGFGFYAGGGFGRASVKLFGEKDSAWAYQLIAGVRTAITPNLDLGLKYRYFRTGKLNYADDFDDTGFDIDTKFASHSLLASLIFNFGEPEVAPMPVAEPAPPPPATQTCPDGSVIAATSYCPAPAPAPEPYTPPPATGERG